MTTLIFIISFFILGLFIGYKLKYPLKKLKKETKEFILNKKRQKFISQWDGIYVYYDKISKIIDSSFTQEFNKPSHYSVCNDLIWNFNHKFWRDTTYDGFEEFEELYHERQQEARNLFDNLRKHFQNHYLDPNKLSKAKGMWTQKIREERLGDLLDN